MKRDDDRLQRYLDGRLSPGERARFEREVEQAPELRAELGALRGVKEALRGATGATAPAELRARVLDGLDSIDREREGVLVRPVVTAWYRRPALGWAALAVLVVGLLFLARPRPAPSLTAAVAAAFDTYQADGMTMQFDRQHPEPLARFMASYQMPFSEQVLSLADPAYRFEGGFIGALHERPAALFAFRAPGGKAVLCQMCPGSLAELPVGGEHHEKEGATVYVFREEDKTMAFWEDKGLLCVLTSDVEPAEVVALALAKARPHPLSG